MFVNVSGGALFQLWHNGSVGGTSGTGSTFAIALLNPNEDVGVVFAANSGPAATIQAQALPMMFNLIAAYGK
jgi:hypothetical protein